MSAFGKKPKIGETLVTEGGISPKDLDNALATQFKNGSRLGEILIAEGKINYFNLYKALAKNQGYEFADLIRIPPDPNLLSPKDRKYYIAMSFIPWKRQGDKIIIATTEVNYKLHEWAAAKFKNYDFVMTSPYDIHGTIQNFFAEEDSYDAVTILWRKNPAMSARTLFSDISSNPGKFYSATGAIAAILLFSKYILAGFFIIINIFYWLTILYKSIFVLGGIFNKLCRKLKPSNKPGINDKDLPVYSILVPMFHEKKETILGILQAIRELDYPKSRLDVKLVVENDDHETIENVKFLNPENIFEIIKVPYCEPRTKPKACNYALKFVKGEYVTIYDAEDRPEPQQLRKAVAKFRYSKRDLVCVQARLNYYNREENLLTRMFAIEYSSWFRFMLPGLELLRVPIPLGGTSNHFPVRILQELYALDPYNVTEDADLGIRIAQSGYRTAMIDSITMEEAPVSFKSWIKQRSRWIKGYMQTYLVHMRKARDLSRVIGIGGMICFSFFIGAPALVFLTMPFIMILSALSYFDGISFPSWFSAMAEFNLISGISAHVIFAAIVVLSEKWRDMWWCVFLFPFYWVMHVMASFRALWQLVTRPHYWDKTEHGVSRVVVRPVS